MIVASTKIKTYRGTFIDVYMYFNHLQYTTNRTFLKKIFKSYIISYLNYYVSIYYDITQSKRNDLDLKEYYKNDL